LSMDVLWLVVAMAVIIILSYKRFNIGLAAFIGAAILCFTSLPFYDALTLLYISIIDSRTVEVTLTVTFITVLGFLMQKLNITDRLMEGLEGVLSDVRLVMMVGPALLGMLPTYGGALFSAPIVDAAGSQVDVDSRMKTFINLWFRHVVFFIYPLTPVIIMISGLTGISISTIIMHTFPMFIISVVLGYVFSVRRVKGFRIGRDKYLLRSLLVNISPILIVVLLTFLLNIPKYLPVLAGIIASIIIGKCTLDDFKHVLFKSRIQNFILATLGLMVFSLTICSVNVSKSIAEILNSTYFSKHVIVLVLPLIIGFITGSPLTSAGLSIPIAQSMSILTPASIAVLYTGATLGYIASPLHLCFILSCEYYRTRLTDIYPYVIPAAIILAFSSIIIAQYLY